MGIKLRDVDDPAFLIRHSLKIKLRYFGHPKLHSINWVVFQFNRKLQEYNRQSLDLFSREITAAK